MPHMYVEEWLYLIQARNTTRVMKVAPFQSSNATNKSSICYSTVALAFATAEAGTCAL